MRWSPAPAADATVVSGWQAPGGSCTGVSERDWQEIDELLQQQAVPVTASRLWLASWCEAHASSWQPWPVLVREGGAVSAAALFARRRWRGVTRVVGMGHGVSDYSRIAAVDEQAADALAGELGRRLASLAGPWSLRVEQLPVLDPVVERLLMRLPQSRSLPGDESPWVDLTASPLGSKSYRQQVRMCRNRVEKEGLALDVSWHYVRDEIEELLPTLARIRRQRDHFLDRLSDLDQPSTFEFWRQVILTLADESRLEVAALRLDGEVKAYCIGITDAPTYYMWDHRFEPGSERYRLGQLLESEVMNQAAASGRYLRVDRMRGATTQKLRTANGCVPAQHLTAWSSRSMRLADETRSVSRARLRELRTSSKAVDSTWRVLKRATVLRGVQA